MVVPLRVRCRGGRVPRSRRCACSVEPALELGQRLGPEPAGDHPAVLAPLHPAGVLQDADVLADRGQRHGVRRGELPQAGRPVGEPLDQPGAGRVAEGGAEDGYGHGKSEPVGSVSRQAMRREERGARWSSSTWLGILLLVPMLWIVLSVFQVQQGAFGVSGAARAAGRAYALAPNDALGKARAEQAARQALADQGLRGAPLTVTVSCTPYPHDCHQGTSVITVRIATQRRPAAAAGRARRSGAELRPRRLAHGPDRPVPGGRGCTPGMKAARPRS